MRRGLRHFSRNEHVLPAFAKHQRVATQPIAFRVLAEITHHRCKGTRQIEIITIEISYDVTRGLGQSLVECMRLTAILFAHPKSEPAFVFANHFDAAVSAATIDDDEFQRIVFLLQDRKYCLFQVLGLIKRGRDNTELRRHTCIRLQDGIDPSNSCSLLLDSLPALSVARVVSYHSIVCLKPSSNRTCARKPNFSSARETSRRRRG